MTRTTPRDTRSTQRADDWRDNASCRTEDPDIFFASEQTSAGRADVRHAKVICWRCPVMQECGRWALENRMAFGVWGGVSEAERRKILRRRGVRLPADLGEADAA